MITYIVCIKDTLFILLSSLCSASSLEYSLIFYSYFRFSVIANALAQMKEDPPGITSSTLSQHAFLAWQLRSGQRRILQLLKKALAS